MVSSLVRAAIAELMEEKNRMAFTHHPGWVSEQNLHRKLQLPRSRA